MLTLSTNSLKKVMECMEEQNNVNKLVKLRNICFRMNQVAVESCFIKLKPSPLVVYFQPSRQEQQNDRSSKEGNLTVRVGETISSNMFKANGERFTVHEIRDNERKRTRMTTNYKVKKSENSVNRAVEHAITEALQKIRSVTRLHLSGFKLDSQFLEMITTLSSKIREATFVIISFCEIEWTEDELLTFLNIFDNLKDLNISGTFRKPIITDHHLSLVSGTMSIWCGASTILHFPGITSKSGENWKNNGIKKIQLDSRMSTALSFQDISGLAEKLKLDKKENKKVPKGCFKLKFGSFKISKKEHREIIKAQRKRNTEWTIVRSVTLIDIVRVSSVNDGYSYELRIILPYEAPNFARLLAKVHQIREQSEEQGVTPRDLNMLMSRLFEVYEILHDYRIRNSLPPHPVHQVPDFFEGQLGIQALANLCEGVILQRIRQQKYWSQMNYQ